MRFYEIIILWGNKSEKAYYLAESPEAAEAMAEEDIAPAKRRAVQVYASGY